MAQRVTRRDKIIVADSVHPEYRAVARTYTQHGDAEIVTIGFDEKTGRVGSLDGLDDKTAAVVIQSPNFFGCVEDVAAIADQAHAVGALLVVVVTEAISFGLLRSPGACGADIVFATIAEDGTVTLLGRGSVCINSGGEKIYPEEVEVAARRHRAVVDATVVGVPHERFGETVVLVCSVSAPTSADDVIATIKRSIADYKAPRRVVFVDEVYRAPNGKADYRWAREQALAAGAG
jgi:glycine cleavage system protein P-like pyridoxal-binding family